MLSAHSQKNDFLIGLQTCMDADSLFSLELNDLPNEMKALVLKEFENDPKTRLALSQADKQWRLFIIETNSDAALVDQLQSMENEKYELTISSRKRREECLGAVGGYSVCLTALGGAGAGIYYTVAHGSLQGVIQYIFGVIFGGLLGCMGGACLSIPLVIPACFLQCYLNHSDSTIDSRHNLRTNNFQFFRPALPTSPSQDANPDNDNEIENNSDSDDENAPLIKKTK